MASPYARKLAADAGVDISQASGSGPGGRVVAQDVQQLIESGGGEAPSADAGAPSAADGATDVSDLPPTSLLPHQALRIVRSCLSGIMHS